ncbi:MAG: flagellar biosynthesis protein FlhB [Paraperlucidibaca sp.]
MSGDDGQEKTEEATPKKIDDARKKGQVPRSRELSTALVTLVAAAALFAWGPQMGRDFAKLLTDSLSPAVLTSQDPEQLPGFFYDLLVQGLLLMWPLMALCFAAALVSSVALGGWTFKLSLKLDQLNPITGLGKVFSTKSLVELGKSLLKVVFIGSAAYGLLSYMTPSILELSRHSAEQAMRQSGGMLLWFFLIVSLPLLVIALIDVPWQIFSFNKQLKMSHQEVSDEHKEANGRPEVKAKIREMQQAAARRRMMEQVPKADVIITNPTHFAIALRYRETGGGAPIVVAKGADEVAARIRALGKAHKVPLVASPRLARALFASTDLDTEIPSGLYLAVAQILTYVYQLRQWEDLGGDYPEAPAPIVDDSYLTGFNDEPQRDF